MHYLFESVLVGVYSCVIFWLVSGLSTSFAVSLFVCGFLKHMCGYYIGVHSYYCDSGYACKRVGNRGPNPGVEYQCRGGITRLTFESILEGFCFVFFGLLFSGVIRSKFCNVFSIGVVLHLVCEWTGMHRYFCRKMCRKVQL
jgi:hypothetical protein